MIQECPVRHLFFLGAKKSIILSRTCHANREITYQCHYISISPLAAGTLSQSSAAPIGEFFNGFYLFKDFSTFFIGNPRLNLIPDKCSQIKGINSFFSPSSLLSVQSKNHSAHDRQVLPWCACASGREMEICPFIPLDSASLPAPRVTHLMNFWCFLLFSSLFGVFSNGPWYNLDTVHSTLTMILFFCSHIVLSVNIK